MADEMKKILDEIKKTHEVMKEYVDRQIEEIRSKGLESSELKGQIEKVNTDLETLMRQYNELRAEANRLPAENRNGKPKTEDEVRAEKAFEKFIRHGYGEKGRAFFNDEEIRSLSQASDASGGFLVPPQWESDLIVSAYDQAEIRPLCNRNSTSRDMVYMPAISKPVVAWGNVNLEVTAQELSAGGQRLQIFGLRALILIHNDTLEDEDANIWQELADLGAQAVAEAEDDAFAVGAGFESPKGIVSDTRVQANYVASGVAAGLTDGTHNGVDALISLFYTPKKTYRRNGTFAMNSTSESVVRQFKDSQGQYLWQPPVQAGVPATLLGRPVINPEGMPDIAANTFPIVFGDFQRGYRIRDRRGVTVQRLVERYAEFLQTGFLLTRRTGGQVTLPEAFSVLKIAVS